MSAAGTAAAVEPVGSGTGTGSGSAANVGAAGWFWGRTPDLLIGCGLGYVLVMPLLFWVASASELRSWPMIVGALLALFLSGPHYGATLLRAYEERAERRKYALFTVWASLGLLALTVAALHSVWLGSLLLTLYVTWAPWHFAGQNYGLSLLFLRRRGITIEPAIKRLLYVSFVLSTVLALLPIHGAVPKLSYALEVTGPTTTYQMQRLGIPTEWVRQGLIVAGVAYVACLVGVAAALRRQARWRELAPAGLLVAAQALWFSLPGFLEGATRYSGRGLVLTALWISAAHSAQYLWITSFYARRDGSGARLGPYLAKTTLLGSAISFVPALLFAPAIFGTFPFDAGLGALVASVVNLHHFLLDGAIWKLRDGRVARVLLRSAPKDEAAPLFAPSRSWIRPVILAAGALGLFVNLFEVQQRRVLSSPDLDPASARALIERLAWVGRDSPQAHVKLGRLLADQGDAEGAMAEFRRALDLVPDADAWSNIGVMHERARRLEEALAAYDAALAVQPDDRKALVRSASVSFELAEQAPDAASAAAHRRSAVERLERLLVAVPAHTTGARRLARAYAEEGRSDDALKVLETTLAATRNAERRAELWRVVRELREETKGAEKGGV